VELHRYVAEEIATDCADGFVSRREALRRLSLIGLSAMGATAVLAACGGDGGGDGRSTASTEPAQPTTTPTALTPGEGADRAQAITISDRHAVFAPADTPKGAVLLIHEIFGLTDHFRSLTGRLAADGYTAITVDLVPGGTASLGDEGRAIAAVTGRPESDVIADLRLGLDELTRRAPGRKLGVMGFCFGGGYTWRLLAAGEPRVAAAIPFYGPAPDAPDFSRSRAAVLAIYGERDARVNATRDVAVAALRAAGLVHEVRTFAGADHGFFNDTGGRYHADAARQAYRDALGWFGRYLAA
jgi:carboxymethylenebutenolidase